MNERRIRVKLRATRIQTVVIITEIPEHWDATEAVINRIDELDDAEARDTRYEDPEVEELDA